MINELINLASSVTGMAIVACVTITLVCVIGYVREEIKSQRTYRR